MLLTLRVAELSFLCIEFWNWCSQVWNRHVVHEAWASVLVLHFELLYLFTFRDTWTFVVRPEYATPFSSSCAKNIELHERKILSISLVFNLSGNITNVNAISKSGSNSLTDRVLNQSNFLDYLFRVVTLLLLLGIFILLVTHARHQHRFWFFLNLLWRLRLRFLLLLIDSF